MALLPSVMIMATMTITMMSKMMSGSVSICSGAYVASFCFLFQTLQQHQHIDILLTSWSEGAYYEEQDDLPQLHFEILPTHHLTRVRFHYNHMTLEIEWDLQSGPDATFWERDEWELGHSSSQRVASPTFHSRLSSPSSWRDGQKHDETRQFPFLVMSKYQQLLDIECLSKELWTSFSHCFSW